MTSTVGLPESVLPTLLPRHRRPRLVEVRRPLVEQDAPAAARLPHTNLLRAPARERCAFAHSGVLTSNRLCVSADICARARCCAPVSPVIHLGMDNVSVRDLRNNGGRVLERVANGESLTVTLDGRPVAELRPLPGRALSAATLLSRWRRLPVVDSATLRADIDRTIDTSL